MLAKVSLWLAENGHKVFVIGRNKEKLNKLCRQNDCIVPVSVDYRDDLALSRQLESMLGSGNIELVVAWIHSEAAPRALSDQVSL